MLIWSRTGRTLACTLAVTLFALFFCLPLAVILMSSLSEQWNGVLPSGFTLSHFTRPSGRFGARAGLQPGYRFQRQPVRAAVWHLGGVGAAPLSGARPAPAEYAVLHTQRGAFGVDRVRDAGGIQPGQPAAARTVPS